MPTIRGKWLFKETPVKTFEGESKRWSVNFRSNNIDCVSIIAGKESDFPAPAIVYEDIGGARMVYSDSDGWFNEAYRTIDFGAKNQDVDDEFYAWLHTNAEEMEHSIEVTSSRTILATAGKYCKKNIAIYESVTDAFWDAFQNFGNRTDYDRAFKGEGWNEVTYKPKYIPKPVNASFMYQNSKVSGRVDVDTSKCTAMDGLFGSAKNITSIGTIDTRKNANTEQAGIFGYMDKLENIDLLILKDDGSQKFSTSCFYGDGKLKEIRIKNDEEYQSRIGNNLNLVQCYALSYESIKSIVGALLNVTEENKRTLTLSQYAWRKLTEEQKAEIMDMKPQYWEIDTTK